MDPDFYVERVTWSQKCSKTYSGSCPAGSDCFKNCKNRVPGTAYGALTCDDQTCYQVASGKDIIRGCYSVTTRVTTAPSRDHVFVDAGYSNVTKWTFRDEYDLPNMGLLVRAAAAARPWAPTSRPR